MQRGAKRLVRLPCGNHRARESSLLVVHLSRGREVTRRHGRRGIRDFLDMVRRKSPCRPLTLPVHQSAFVSSTISMMSPASKERSSASFLIRKEANKRPKSIQVVMCVGDLHHRCTPRRRVPGGPPEQGEALGGGIGPPYDGTRRRNWESGCVLCDLLLSARQASGDEVGVGLTQLLLVDEKRDIVLDLLDDVSDVSC